MTATTKTFELPAEHPIRKLEARRLEVIQERHDLERQVREARAFLSESNTGPNPPDERQLMMNIRRAENRDLVHGKKEAEPLRQKLDQARAEYQAAREEFERRSEEARALILPKYGNNRMTSLEAETKAVLARELSDLDALIWQAKVDLFAPLMPEAEERYRQAAKQFMEAYLILATIKSTRPRLYPIQAPYLPKLDVLDYAVVPDYMAAKNSAVPSVHRQLNEDLRALMDQLVPMAYRGEIPQGLLFTTEPNSSHDPKNPYSPRHNYGVKVIPPVSASV